MNPNFDAMSKAELKAYVLSHRDDLNALDALVSRRSPDSEAVWFHPPKNREEEQEQFELFKQMINEREKKHDREP